jgi:heme/copper-type cytochrome/quinol oxidase subunit 3
MRHSANPKTTVRIFLIKLGHSLIYLFMSFCLGYMFYAAITATYDWKLVFAIGMIVLETIILAFSGWRCPLSAWARSLGDKTGNDLLSDYLLPDWLAKLTVPFCTLVFLSGLTLVLVTFLLRR